MDGCVYVEGVGYEVCDACGRKRVDGWIDGWKGGLVVRKMHAVAKEKEYMCGCGLVSMYLRMLETLSPC